MQPTLALNAEDTSTKKLQNMHISGPKIGHAYVFFFLIF